MTASRTNGKKSAADYVRLHHDPVTGIETVRAQFHGHAYDMHRHQEWLIGVTHHGLQNFFCRGRRRISTTGRVILIEPGEVHDGHAEGEEGFSYSMLYLPQAWMAAQLCDGPRTEAGFRASLSADPALAAAIAQACLQLRERGPRLCIDAALDGMMNRLRRHLGRPPQRREPKAGLALARRARDCLHALLDEDIGADELARRAGAANRFQLARLFRAAYGSAPHAYLVQIRLAQARHLLAAGENPADVAAACGFADQSHLTRWFRRAYRLTPAFYRRACTDVPDCKAPLP